MCLAVTSTLGPAAAPAAAENFYAGKTIDFIVGASPGGGYDVYARLLARHMNRHIPGKPDVVVKNMPGAGSAKAASFVYSLANKDGTTLGAVFPGALMEPLLGERTKQAYDPVKFHYIGTADSGTRLCVTFHTSPTKTYEDARRRKTIVGASQAGGSTRDYAFLQNKLTGAKFEVVSGYKGTIDILLAMERGEVEGMCGYDWSSIQTQRADWLRDKKINILVQVALDVDPTLKQMGVPPLWAFIDNEDNRKVAELVVSQQVFGRPYFLPPGTPARRVKILRDAFSATMTDAQFLADAQKARLSIEPLSGERVQQIVQRLYASPKSIVDQAKQAISP
jgi:tripartite-type tricarboxylate transporter receptor subunit TctC